MNRSITWECLSSITRNFPSSSAQENRGIYGKHHDINVMGKYMIRSGKTPMGMMKINKGKIPVFMVMRCRC